MSASESLAAILAQTVAPLKSCVRYHRQKNRSA